MVHSTELTILKCSESRTSCILTLLLWVAPTLSFVDLSSTLHTIHQRSVLKSYQVSYHSNPQVNPISSICYSFSPIVRSHETFGRIIFDQTIIHNHFEWHMRIMNNATASSLYSIPFLCFHPLFSRVCTMNHTPPKWDFRPSPHFNGTMMSEVSVCIRVFFSR